MPVSAMARARRRALLSVLLLLAVIVGAGVLARVRVLHREMMTRWRGALEGGAQTTESTVDEWFAERAADAEGLATSVGIHATSGAPITDHSNPFIQVIRPIQRRAKFVAIWVIDSTGRVISRSTNDTLHAAELAAAREAVQHNRVTRSE